MRNQVEVKRVTLFVARLLASKRRRKFNILTIEFPRTEINFSLFLFSFLFPVLFSKSMG